MGLYALRLIGSHHSIFIYTGKMSENPKVKPKIVVIVGPTASGKSDLAVEIAREFNGEIISADSRQVYRGLDIGTGKITAREMRGIPHYLLDVASPQRTFTIANYKPKAERALQSILTKGKLPIICGGTGFYIQALVDGVILPDAPPNEALRKQLDGKTTEELFLQLLKLDPNYAAKVDRHNPRRLVRAIEIAQALGRVPTLKKQTPYDPIFIGINVPLEKLRERIHARLAKRMRQGMLSEVRRLHESGLSWKRMEELGLEYRYLARHLRGLISKETMLAELEHEIAQYAKRQYTWFRKDKRVQWIAIEKIKKAGEMVKEFLKN